MRHFGSKLVSGRGRSFPDRKVSGGLAGKGFASFLALIAAAPQALAQTQFLSLDSLNASDLDKGTFRVDINNLEYGLLSTDPVSGNILKDKLSFTDLNNSQEFHYIAVYFKSNATGNFKFGQNESINDTAMLLYDGKFDPLKPNFNFIDGIDDANQELHKAVTGIKEAKCANSLSFCPQLTHEISADKLYSLVVTTADGSPFSSDISFYTDALGSFATNTSAFEVADMGGIKNPLLASNVTIPDFFNGGTVIMDQDETVDLGVWETGGTFDTSGGSVSIGVGLPGGNFNGANGSSVNEVPVKEMSGKVYDYNGKTGRVTVKGGRELRLSGENTHTGGIEVTENTTLTLNGTRSIGQDSVTLNNGVLSASAPLTVATPLTITANTANTVLAVDNDIALAGGVAGDGELTLAGGGTVRIGGASSFAGSVTVTDGTELVLGARGALAEFRACDKIIVDGGATLSGGGVNCSIDARNATLSPGFSPGARTTIGYILSNSQTNHTIQIDGPTYNAQGGAGSYDREVVAGTFTAAGTLTVQLRGIDGAATNTFTPTIGDNFITHIAQSVVGTFDVIAQPTEGLAANQRIDIVYSPTSIRLAVTPVSYRTLAANSGWRANATTVVGELDAVRPAVNATTGQYQPLFNNIYGLNTQTLEKAAAQLSGEIHTNAVQANAEASKQALRSVGDAIGHAGFTGAGLWMQYMGSWTPQRDDRNTASFTSKNNGFAIGANVVSRDNLRIGFAGSYLETRLSNFIGGYAKGKMVGGYGYVYVQPANSFDLAAVLGASWSDLNTTRETAGYLTTHTAYAKTDGHNLMGSVKARYRLAGSGPFSVWAASGLVMGENVANPFAETAGDSLYTLKMARSAWTSIEGNLGLDVEHKTEKSQIAVSLNWQHQLSRQTAPVGRAELQGLSWKVLSNRLDRDAFSAGFSIRHRLSDYVSLRAAYEGQLRDGQTLSRASVGLGITF